MSIAAKSFATVLLATAALALALTPAIAQPSTAVSAATNSASPTLRPSSPVPVKPATSTRSNRSRTPEAFALVGIGGYGQRSVALFDGSDPRFKQMLHAGETIGEFTLLNISADHVDLQSPTGIVQLALLKQLRHDNGSDWSMIDLGRPFTPSNIQKPGSRASIDAQTSTSKKDSGGKSSRREPSGNSTGRNGQGDFEPLSGLGTSPSSKADKGNPSRKPSSTKASKKFEKRTRSAL
jgi:hypothetical protein